ncbi:hypothetical protein DH2020_046857 [Rehmannia glutinosa]|uniref:Growth-regulating factor n=1 Tax=Rehmannia glutinosa TaxID=99300 RepID=A0ABR0UA32_REHGL
MCSRRCVGRMRVMLVFLLCNEDERGDGLLAAEKREDFSQEINLDLGIGRCACANEEGLKGIKKIKQEKKESCFTAAQFHEFYNHVLVYNAIASGLPVPLYLFLPIWMSVFNSFGHAIYKIYPSFLGFSPQSSDRKIDMDPEPGRCRRTDGRKWRCSKNVVPNQKYCERHMHRGRQGSRKRVEPIQIISRLNNKIFEDNKMPIVSLVTSDMENKIANPGGDDLDQSQPSTLGLKKACADSINIVEGEESSFENANPRKIGSRKHGMDKNNYLSFGSPRFGLSPKSVLHCGAGKVSLGLDNKNVIENFPQRCRRTDGKKWQCRRDAVPNQKYCQRHMHRGAKRLILNPESSTYVPATTATKARSSSAIARIIDNSINLNTIPASPQHITANNSTSSSSDATTITDENISFCVTHSHPKC